MRAIRRRRKQLTYFLDEKIAYTEDTFIKQLDLALLNIKDKLLSDPKNKYSDIDIIHEGVAILHLDSNTLNVNTEYCEFCDYIANHKIVKDIIKYIESIYQ